MANTWFRFYNAVVHDPKVQRLQGETFKAWVNMLCVASENDGLLPSVPDLAFTLRMSERETSELLNQLFSLGLLDAVEVDDAPMGYTPHNWKDRQFKSDSSTERVKRFRDKERNVSVTPPDTDTEQIQNRKKHGACAPGWPVDAVDLFWQEYPHKVGKAAALRKLAIVRRTVPWQTIMDGLRRYKQTKPADRPWCNPATWLNEGRWDDGPLDGSQPAAQAALSLEDAVSMYAKTGRWSRWAPCPEPGQLGCTVPPEMFAKYGLLPDGRKVA